MLKNLTPHRQSGWPICRQFREDADEVDISLSPASIGGRPLCNLQFVDDIDLLWSSEEELQQINEKLEKTAAGYGMEISSDKSKERRKHTLPMTRPAVAYYGKTKWSAFLQRLNSIVLSIQLNGCESWTPTADLHGETNPSLWKQMLQEVSWHITDSIKRTNTYGNRTISSSDTRKF